MKVSMHLEFNDDEQTAVEAVGAMLRALSGVTDGGDCSCKHEGPAGVHWPTVGVDLAVPGSDQTVIAVWPTTLEPPVREVINPSGGPIDCVTNAGEAFSGAPLQTVNVVPPPVSVPVTNPVELDSRGLPWDRRIHASTRTKCKDGSWKNSPGVDKEVLAGVEAELQGAMSAPIPPAATLADAAVVSAALQTPPTPPIPPAASTTPAPGTYAEMMLYITSNASAKRFTYQDVIKVCQDNGLAGIPLLNARPDMIPTIHAALEAIACQTTAA